MSGLASPVEQNSLELNFFAVDDHIDELEPAIKIAVEYGFNPEKWASIRMFGNAIEKRASPYNVIVSDNHLDGVENLEVLGHSDIDTGHGTNAGWVLLTEYCDRENIESGLRIVLTNYSVDKNIRNLVKRKQNKGERIFLLDKSKKNDMKKLDKLLYDFRNQCLMDFISEKFEYVSNIIEGWDLTSQEIGHLFGVSDLKDSFWKAIHVGTTSVDVEARCDLIYRMKSNLVYVYGGEDLEQETIWLRTPIEPLNGLSPLEFIRHGSLPDLERLVLGMEGK